MSGGNKHISSVCRSRITTSTKCGLCDPERRQAQRAESDAKLSPRIRFAMECRIAQPPVFRATACASATPSNPHGPTNRKIDDRQDERVDRPAHLKIRPSVATAAPLRSCAPWDVPPAGKRPAASPRPAGPVPTKGPKSNTTEIGSRTPRQRSRPGRAIAQLETKASFR